MMDVARERIGKRGLFVVADVANLPFAEVVMDGVVSLPNLHHLTPKITCLPTMSLNA
jgi:ubiquinone/menaquinone biosynthesis C-methylase UbiE